MPEVWEVLWEKYQRERRKVMDKEVFEVLLQVFPAILVAQADGFTDTSELSRLEEVVRFLCKDRADLYAKLDWRSEMRYLAIDAEFWRRSFIEALRSYLEAFPEKYFQQAEFLYAVAAASTGDIVKNILLQSGRLTVEGVKEFISERERSEIRRLSEELGLSNHPEASSYLRRLIGEDHG